MTPRAKLRRALARMRFAADDALALTEENPRPTPFQSDVMAVLAQRLDEAAEQLAHEVRRFPDRADDGSRR